MLAAILVYIIGMVYTYERFDVNETDNASTWQVWTMVILWPSVLMHSLWVDIHGE